ncbi:amidase [Ancylobacter sp. FA202]|uniref:amidase n=1 Tax=Ancylobacter sp. FA202 TaxID=1111106 RepID=UPI00037D5518|nr:amidase [Ancylobacter sp. FA202]
MNIRQTAEAVTTEPCELSAVAAAAAIARGELTSVALVTSLLNRIAERREAVQAWVYLDPEKALAEARAADARTADVLAPSGPLHGVPVGLKDIINVAGMPTRFNSPIYPDYIPFANSACAAMIRKAGGFILGKTVTTEFANRHPGPTMNPHDPARTPGGSSQGSAAAVADRQVPLAIGTQTSGSIIRPAAFCGIVGYKPSFGEISRVGVKPHSGTLDTLGLCARSVGDVELLRAVLVGIPYEPVAPATGRLRVAICRDHWDAAEPAARASVESVARLMEASGAEIGELVLPPALFQGWQEDHRRIANFEAARGFGHEKRLHRDKLSREFYEGRVLDGEMCSVDDYIAAQRRSEAMRVWIEGALEDIDVVLTPAAAGEAPLGLARTGDAGFNSLWTLLYTPSLTLPCGRGPAGMPLGVQLIGRRFEDERLFAIASAVEQMLARV